MHISNAELQLVFNAIKFKNTDITVYFIGRD